MLVRSIKVIALAALCALAAEVTHADPVQIRVAWTAAPGELPALLPFKKDVAKHWDKSYAYQDIHFQGTPQMITAFAAGEIDLAPIGFSTLAIAVNNAKLNDLRVIADEIRDGVSGWHSVEFMALKDGPVKKIEDIKGRVVATNIIGSGGDVAMRYMLYRHDLQTTRDYTLIEAAYPNMKSLLFEQKAALVPIISVFGSDPELREKAFTLYTIRDALGETDLTVWTARNSFLKQNRAAVVDFLEDYLRILRWYIDPVNRPEALDIVSKFMKQPVERFEKTTFNHEDFYRAPDGLPNVKALQTDINATETLGLIKQHLDVSKYLDLSYVQEADKRLR